MQGLEKTAVMPFNPQSHCRSITLTVTSMVAVAAAAPGTIRRVEVEAPVAVWAAEVATTPTIPCWVLEVMVRRDLVPFLAETAPTMTALPERVERLEIPALRVEAEAEELHRL
jgi:hypothetical protein